MKQKPLSKGAKIRARFLALRVRGDADAESDQAMAAEMNEVADALMRLGAVSPGTPNEARALCVMDVVSATGWSRTRAAKWVLGERAWEANENAAWHKRLARVKAEAAIEKLKREREAGIEAYAASVSDTQAARLVRATRRLTIKTRLGPALAEQGDGLGT